MTGRPAAPAEMLHNRCRCGHFPTTHMVVRPADPRAEIPGGYRLEASGACRVCGEAACPRYTPAG